MMRSGNPVLQQRLLSQARPIAPGEEMTIQGTVNKTFVTLLLLMFSASLVWRNPVAFMPFMWVSIIGGFIIAIVTAFRPQWAAVTAPAYAFVEGLFLGCISALMDRQYPGIVLQAVGLTFGTLFAMLLLYKSRIIKVTEKFRMGVVAATGGVCLFYFLSMILGFFGISMPLIHSAGVFGIGFSLFVVGLAALNLVLDFDIIERAAQAGAPKFMEWYGAFALMVTLIWLYIEILRLLAKTRSRR